MISCHLTCDVIVDYHHSHRMSEALAALRITTTTCCHEMLSFFLRTLSKKSLVSYIIKDFSETNLEASEQFHSQRSVRHPSWEQLNVSL